MIEITPKRFYITGIICFSIIAVFNIANFIAFFSATNFFSKMSSLGGIVFNIALVGFFFFLLRQEPAMEEVAASDDIEEIIKEVKKK